MLGRGADEDGVLVPAMALADRHHRHQFLPAGDPRPTECRDDVVPDVVDLDGDAQAGVLERVDYHGKGLGGVRKRLSTASTLRRE